MSAPTADPLLCTHNVAVARSGRTILHDLSVQLKPGRLTALLGPNGSGKSSLVRLLSGEWVPSAGTVTLADKPLPSWRPEDLARRRAVLPQQPQLAFPFTVAEVVRMGRHPQPEARRPHDAAIVAAALRDMDLEELAERPADTLSGGERQRMHLARVFAQIHPEETPNGFLLLDEPLNNLDPPRQLALLRHLRTYAQRGIGVLLTLHDLNLALHFADEVWLLREGALQAVGPAEKVLNPRRLTEVFGLGMRWIAGGEALWIVTPPRDEPS